MRPLTPRRGTTAVELLIVLTLLAGVLAALHAVVQLAARETTAATTRTAAARDQLALWALLTRELAHTSTVDVAVPAHTAIEFDRPIGEAPACATGPFAVLLRSHAAWFIRQPAPGRDHLLLREATATGSWSSRGIVSVAMANCPDGAPAIRLTTSGAVAATGFVRVVEPVRLRSYPSGATHALGLEPRSGSGTIQPLAGPLAPLDFTATLFADAVRIVMSRSPLTPLHLDLPLQPSP